MNALLLSHAWLAALALLAFLFGWSWHMQRHRERAPGLNGVAQSPSGLAMAGSKPGPQRSPRPDSRPKAQAQALRVLRVVEPGAPASGRIRISGRMADVCAELDRLAAREALTTR